MAGGSVVVLRQFWAEMIGVNVLFILCCLPLVTIPAAWCGLHRVILNRVRARHEPVLSSFFKVIYDRFSEADPDGPASACGAVLAVILCLAARLRDRLAGYGPDLRPHTYS